jgi:hypothetical protein
LPVNNEQTIRAWSSSSALNRAINSYGDSEEAFLSSDSAGYAENEPIQLMPLSVTYEGDTYIDGDFIGLLYVKDGNTMNVQFNQNFRGNIQHIYIDTTQTTSGTIEQPTPSINGQVVSWTISKGSIGDEAIIRAIRIVTDDETYRMNFSTSSGGYE